MRHSYTIALALFLFGTHLALSAPTPCSNDAITTGAQRVNDARHALLTLPVGDGTTTDVSRQAQDSIAKMKADLEHLFVAYMACAAPDAEPKRIEQELSSIAHAFVLEGGSYTVDQLPKEANNYGYQLEFHVQRSSPNSNVLGISASFQIKCGMDSVLSVFENDGNSWKHVLNWTSKPYKTVAGGLWTFDYGISPPDKYGRWYIVTKSIAPWCSSTWSAIRYAVLRPNPLSSQPTVLRSASDSIWWGNEDMGKLSVNTDNFDLRFHAESIDGGVHNRLWIRHFSVVGGKVQRIQPVAVSPRDFVDEWLVSSWVNASKWSVPEKREILRQVHERLKRPRGGEFDSIRTCVDLPNHVQVAVQLDESRIVYFQVFGNEQNYKMDAVTNASRPQCAGPDILESMATQ